VKQAARRVPAGRHDTRANARSNTGGRPQAIAGPDAVNRPDAIQFIESDGGEIVHGQEVGWHGVRCEISERVEILQAA
jgi:hypothetical protein